MSAIESSESPLMLSPTRNGEAERTTKQMVTENIPDAQIARDSHAWKVYSNERDGEVLGWSFKSEDGAWKDAVDNGFEGPHVLTDCGGQTARCCGTANGCRWCARGQR